MKRQIWTLLHLKKLRVIYKAPSALNTNVFWFGNAYVRLSSTPKRMKTLFVYIENAYIWKCCPEALSCWCRQRKWRPSKTLANFAWAQTVACANDDCGIFSSKPHHFENSIVWMGPKRLKGQIGQTGLKKSRWFPKVSTLKFHALRWRGMLYLTAI